ncbi:homocysteine S-methyltransferase 1-like protein [Corchorus olitorius]|uniref:Homocysteine S-methyltransferase 1-like protein n=1 Tax=Corchorus olitorius TaxID=93759 RepID=A0A1R3GEP4_9ROSI|nr:homocysteine S-methyltransferase 1-like protein [Corchorus olitorius]
MASRVRALSQPPMNAKACLKPRLGALGSDMTSFPSNYGCNILNPKLKPNYHCRRLKYLTSLSHQALKLLSSLPKLKNPSLQPLRTPTREPKSFESRDLDLKWIPQSTWGKGIRIQLALLLKDMNERENAELAV